MTGVMIGETTEADETTEKMIVINETTEGMTGTEDQNRGTVTIETIDAMTGIEDQIPGTATIDQGDPKTDVAMTLVGDQAPETREETTGPEERIAIQEDERETKGENVTSGRIDRQTY